MGRTRTEFIECQKAVLYNTTLEDDNVNPPVLPIEFIQLFDFKLNLTKNVTKHQLTDNTIDNMYSLLMDSIEGKIVLTITDLEYWLARFKSSQTDDWKITYTDDQGVEKSLAFKGEVAVFDNIRPEDDDITFFFRIECTESVVIS